MLNKKKKQNKISFTSVEKENLEFLSKDAGGLIGTMWAINKPFFGGYLKERFIFSDERIAKENDNFIYRVYEGLSMIDMEQEPLFTFFENKDLFTILSFHAFILEEYTLKKESDLQNYCDFLVSHQLKNNEHAQFISHSEEYHVKNLKKNRYMSQKQLIIAMQCIINGKKEIIYCPERDYDSKIDTRKYQSFIPFRELFKDFLIKI